MELNKKVIFITVGLVAAVVVSSVLYQFFFKEREVDLISPGGQLTGLQKETSQLTTWKDTAGFSFDYPSSLQTNPHLEDEENYAHLELSDPSHPGEIIVWMKDTALKNINDWEPEEFETGRGNLIDSQLGGHSARKAAFVDGRVITAALDAEVIALIELLSGDLAFWQPIYDQILASFEFVPLAAAKPQTSPGTTSSSGGGEIWLEEEVVE